MVNAWNAQKKELLDAAGWKCELCGGDAQQIDHAIFPRARYRKNVKELDEKYNLIVTCANCNQKKPREHYDPYPTYGAWAMDVNIAKYGAEPMAEWLRRVPLKIKDY